MQYMLILSRTVAPLAGKNSMNMVPVDWKYNSFFSLDWITGLISWRPSSWNRVQHYGRTERFGGGISFTMHHPEPAAVSQRSQSIRLGAQSSRGVRRRCVVRPTSVQSDTLGPLRDCSGLWMVHIEMAAAVESFGSTEMLDSISAA